MAVEKKPSNPSIYNDRSDIGSSEELDEYGVWVKSEPQDLSSEGNPDSPDLEDPDFSDVSLDLPDDEDPDAPPNFEDFPVDDSDLEDTFFNDVSGPINNVTVEEPDTIVDMEELKDNLEEAPGELEEPLPFVEEIPEDDREGFSEISLEDFLDDGKTAESGALYEPYATEASKAPQEQSKEINLSTELLSRIVEELGGIRNEIRNLKKELNTLSQGAPQEAEAGGFFDEDNDEKIALTGDELDNILQSADFTEESGSDEALPDDFSAALDELSQDSQKDEEINPFNMDDPAGEDFLDDPILEDDEHPLSLDDAAEEGLLDTPNLEDDGDFFNLDSVEDDNFQDLLDDTEEGEDLPDPLNVMDSAEDDNFQDLLDDTREGEDLPDPLNVMDDGLEDDNFDFQDDAPQEEGEFNLDEGEVFEIDDELQGDELSDEGFDSPELSEDILDTEEASEELKQLMEDGAEPMTEAPEDTSYLDDDKDLSGESTMDFSNAIIDEPDLSENLQENPVNDPELDDISLELDLEDEVAPEVEEEADAKDIELELDLDDNDELSLDDFGDDEKDDLSFLEPDSLEGIEEPLEADPAEPLSDLDIPEDFIVEEDTSFPEIEEDDVFDDLEDEDPELEPISFPEIEETPLSLEEEENLLETGDLEPSDLEDEYHEVAEAEFEDSAKIPDDLRKELRTVLSYMDQLLESLPEDKIEEFAKSEHFNTYKKLFEELGLA